MMVRIKLEIFIYSQLKSSFMKKLFTEHYSFFTQGLKTFLISFIILFIFQVLFLRDLKVITEYFKNLDIKDPSGRIKLEIDGLNEKKYHDEINFLVQVSNRLISVIVILIKQTFKRLSQQEMN